MLCPKCGKELSSTAKFCDECGERLYRPGVRVNQKAKTVKGELDGLEVDKLADLPESTDVVQDIETIEASGIAKGLRIGKGKGLSEKQVSRLFEQIMDEVEKRIAEYSESEKAQIRQSVKEVQTQVEVIEKDVSDGRPPDTSGLSHKLRRMAPDILAVIEKTLMSPLAGVAEIIRRVAEKVKAETDMP